MMKIYMAPLEGITSYIFRNAFAKYYGGIDRYFTPFITPHPKKGFSPSEKRVITKLPRGQPKLAQIFSARYLVLVPEKTKKELFSLISLYCLYL